MGDPARNRDHDRPSAEPRKVVAGDPPNIEEQDPPLEATDSEDVDGDDDDDDDDMDGTDEYSAASVTVRSSIWEHEFEGGRRYHHYRHGRYPLPNDDEEQEREYMKHVLHLEQTGGRLFNAPIPPNPQKILDLFAKTFPSAEIVGLDLSPIQPFMVPPNVRFLVDDVEDEWMDRGGYDFIHLRHSCMYLKDMDKLINNCYSHLKEGGWLEITDYCTFIRCDDDTMPPGHPPAQVARMMHQCLLNYGMNGYTINELEQKYKNAGFKNIQCRVIKTPIGSWPKDPKQREIGTLFRDIINELIRALAAKPLKTLNWSEAEMEVYLAEARKALWDKKVHCYTNFISWWAQK
ncbi:secondary metabolism regulator LAE1 [Trichoderma asperellum]|uniref:Secondary metabolism regulator LAE1 n=1 Tax=Trichoderma asperellum TaxID=101201 RepID=A0A6V8R3K9_TRIAP|nr:secondary metabolism regulator LAE1 [Trichoderma asperellum]